MRVDTSLFYNQYEDIILTSTACPIAPCLQPNSVGEAKEKGVEGGAEIQPLDRLMIGTSRSCRGLENRETKLPVTSISRDRGGPYTPEWKASMGMQYTFPLGSVGELVARVDAAYTSEV